MLHPRLTDLIPFSPTKSTAVAAARSSIRLRDCSSQVGSMSSPPSTPSAPGQHTCCNCNQRTNPQAAAALSVADRIAACHHWPVKSSTSQCHKRYLCIQYFSAEQVNVSFILPMTYTLSLSQESAAIITVANGVQGRVRKGVIYSRDVVGMSKPLFQITNLVPITKLPTLTLNESLINIKSGLKSHMLKII